MKSHYQTLGLADCVSVPEIRRAYRTLALRHHPDRGGDQERMKEINEAYAYLMRNKDEYDQRLQGTAVSGFRVVINGWEYSGPTMTQFWTLSE